MFALRRCSAPAAHAAFAAQVRRCATGGPPEARSSLAPEDIKHLVEVRESALQEICILEMNCPKANVLISQLMTRLLEAIAEVCDPDAKQRYHGIILTSKVPGIFSGGLDIKSLLHNKSQERFTEYWGLFQQLFSTLHGLPVPLAVAINGHSAAGGTVVALAADYRVMARHRQDGRPATIGLAGSRYGLAVPPYVVGSMERVVGFRRAEDLIVNGLTLSADEALSIGLVDDVVEHYDEALVPCLQYMEKVLALPSPLPYWIYKDFARKKVMAPLCTQALRDADTESFYNMLQNPTVRADIERHVSGLGQKRTPE